MNLYIGIGTPFRNNKRLWTPAQVSNLALWFDAADASTITLNGSNVSQWNDKSGKNHHATQASASYQPAYDSVNKYVSFDGSDDRMLTNNVSATELAGANGNDVIIASVVSYHVSGMLLWWGESANRLGIENENIFNFNNPTTGKLTGWSEVLSSSPKILIASNSNAAQTVRLNGAQVGTKSSTGLTITGTYAMALGGIYASQEYYGGYRVREILAIPNSSTYIEKIEGYLAHKWGLTASLPSNHTYKEVAP